MWMEQDARETEIAVGERQYQRVLQVASLFECLYYKNILEVDLDLHAT